jgi:O-antigen ligase/tetratricopeptide (TPR) repeat protein
MARTYSVPLGAASAVRAATDDSRGRGRAWAARLARLHPWVAAPSALALLLYPNPLIAPAAILGALPLLGRWIAVGRPWPRTVLDLPLALLLAGGLLGATAGLNGEAIAMRLSGLLAGLFLYALAVTHIGDARRFRLTVLVLLGLSAIASLALVNMAAPFLHLDRLPTLATLAQVVDPWGFTQGLSDEEALLKRYRLRPSGVGALADIGLALAFAAALGLSTWRSRAFLLVPTALFCAVLFVTDSRASLVAGAVTLGTMAGFWNVRMLPLIPLGGLAVLLMAGAGLATKGMNLRTIEQRFWFWENSLYLAQEYPITGVGLGTQSVQLTYRTYFLPSFPAFSHAHNIYLQALLEQGVLGMVALVALTLGAVWLGWRARLAEDRWVRAGGMAGLGMALVLCSIGLGEITAVSPIGSALLLMALGLVAAAGSGVPATAPAADAPPGMVARLRAGAARHRRAILAGLAVAIMVGGLVGGTRLAAVTLLNIGSIEVNRALVSEETTKEERQRYLDQSLWLLRTAAALDPTHPSIQRNLAIALAATEDTRRARQAADRARDQTEPDDRRGMFQVGRTYVAVGNWAEAIKAWQAAEAGPQLLQLGQRLLRSRNWDQASAAFRATAALMPDSRGAYEGIVRAAEGRNDDPAQVAQQFAPLIALGGQHAYFSHLELARYFRQLQRPTRSLAHIREAGLIRVDADHALEEGATFVQLGRYVDAEPLLKRAVAAITEQLGRVRDDPLEPNRSDNYLAAKNLDAFYWLAVVQARTGQTEAALATAREALEYVDPSRRNLRTPFLAIIGDALVARGQPAEALEASEQAGTASSDDPHVLDTMARATAIINGGSRNLVANPGFEWDGAWRLVPEGDPGESDLLATQSAGQGKRSGQIAPGRDGTRYAAQLVTGLRPGESYRLSALVRTKDLRDGSAVLRVLSRVPPGESAGESVAAIARTATRSEEWLTLELPFVAQDAAASVEIGFPEGANRGATAWFDEVTLIPMR